MKLERVDMLRVNIVYLKNIEEEFKNEEKNLYDLIKDISTFI